MRLEDDILKRTTTIQDDDENKRKRWSPTGDSYLEKSIRKVTNLKKDELRVDSDQIEIE
jgi:hypothetical protein